MIADFPSYLILQPGSYSTTFDPGIYRTEMDSGPAKTRPKKCRTMKIFNVLYHACSIENKLAFETWWKSDIKMGALWFKWYDIETKTILRTRMRGEPSFQLKDKQMNSWDISLQLEVWC
jgi:hypothetical protein